MTKSEMKAYRQSPEFVKLIDAKWGHTYEDVTND
jgi:hypothetical protein